MRIDLHLFEEGVLFYVCWDSSYGSTSSISFLSGKMSRLLSSPGWQNERVQNGCGLQDPGLAEIEC